MEAGQHPDPDRRRCRSASVSASGLRQEPERGLRTRAGFGLSPLSGDRRDDDDRAARIDWTGAAGDLADRGAALLPDLLTAEECIGIAALYSDDGLFRSRVVMARHGYGKGEYKYFAYPLPALIGRLRAALYPRLAPIANEWNGRMRLDMRYPASHKAFLDRCHAAGRSISR